MKPLIIFFLFTCFLSKAQSPVYSLVDNGYGYHQTSGVYYKDTYNDFNKFEGTWKFQNGNISLTIMLHKLTMYYDADDNAYIDIIVGEYKYIDINGNEIVNTLSNINNGNPYANNISGLLLYSPNNAGDARKVKLDFIDPQRSYLNRFIMVKYIAADGSTPPKIEIKFGGDTSIAPDENSPTSLRIPEQDYTLTKIL